MSGTPYYLHKFKRFGRDKKTRKQLNDLINGKLYHATTKQLKDPHDYNCPQSAVDTRVCSLAGGSNSNYMLWAHYADHMNGFAFEYRYQDIVRAINESNRQFKIVKVKYMVELTPDNRSLEEKYFQWFYEREYRILLEEDCKDQKAYLHVKPNAVCIGKKVFEAKKKEIRKWGKSNGIKIRDFDPQILVCRQKAVFEGYKKRLGEVKKTKKA